MTILTSQKIAFVTYETPFAPCGGIAAVIGRLPGYLRQASGLHTVVITPYHHKLAKTKSLKTRLVGSFKLIFDGAEIKVNILGYDDKWTCYFLQAEDERFFAGNPHPYFIGETQEEIAENLLRDALFFGAAVAKAIEVLDSQTNWTLLLQDWEAATTALALAAQAGRHKLFITLHNSYDSRATDADLLRVGINPSYCPAYKAQSGFSKIETVLARALLLVQSPVFTVSEQFAVDLLEDHLQAQVMAKHIQELLRSRLLGVNNGPFKDLVVKGEIVNEARQGNFSPFQRWKTDNKKQSLEALNNLVPSESTPIWGDLEKFDTQNDACWFVMAGRDDTRQKGYDVAVAAITAFLERGGDARFFFFPIPGDEGLGGLMFLRNLTRQFPEKVIAFPFLWKEGFEATLRGASYGIMPSLYEPFGMANEFYLSGTVGIGRATGGIIQQIVPLRAASSLSQTAELRARRWHLSSSHPTGLLVGEDDNTQSIEDWQSINRVGYNLKGAMLNRIDERKQYSLFRLMAQELSLGIEDGVKIYHERPNLYYRMLIEGIDFIRNSFSWEKAAHEYYRHVQ